MFFVLKSFDKIDEDKKHITERVSLPLLRNLENFSTLSFQWIQWEAQLCDRSMDYTTPRDFVLYSWHWVSCRLQGDLPPKEPPVQNAGWTDLILLVSTFKELQRDHLPLWVGIFPCSPKPGD